MNNQEKAQWLSDRWAEVAQGGQWECNGIPAPYGADLACEREQWRVVMPTFAKVIDLSCLIESGIDCELRNPNIGINTIGLLKEIGGNGKFRANGVSWNICQPRMNHDHYWGGKSSVCPLPEGFVIQVHWDTGTGFSSHEYEDYTSIQWLEVIAFRVLRKADGWVMPFEVGA